MAHHKPRPRSPSSKHSTVCVECGGVLTKALGPHLDGGWAHMLVNGALVNERDFSVMVYVDQAEYMSIQELRVQLELKNQIIRRLYDDNPARTVRLMK